MQEIEAEYAGDQNFSPSTGTNHVIIDRYAVSVTVTGNPNPTIYCQPVTFTSTVTSGGPYGPVGNVAFNGEFFFPGTVPLENGTATRTYHACPPYGTGGDVEYASYYGDPYNDWGSGGVTQVVNPTTTTVNLKSSKKFSPGGKPVTFVVVVTAPYEGAVDGSVAFTSGETNLVTVVLKDSRGSVTTSSLPVGANTITATYTPGNGNFLGSSGSIVETIQ